MTFARRLADWVHNAERTRCPFPPSVISITLQLRWFAGHCSAAQPGVARGFSAHAKTAGLASGTPIRDRSDVPYVKYAASDEVGECKPQGQSKGPEKC